MPDALAMPISVVNNDAIYVMSDAFCHICWNTVAPGAQGQDGRPPASVNSDAARVGP